MILSYELIRLLIGHLFHRGDYSWGFEFALPRSHHRSL